MNVAHFRPIPSLPGLGPRLARPDLAPFAPRWGLQREEPRATVAVRLYLLREGKLGVASRQVQPGTAIAAAALGQLLAGPSGADMAAGLSTAVPVGTRLLGASESRGTVAVELTRAFAGSAGTLPLAAPLAQVVYTLTQFPGVSGAWVNIDGRPVGQLGRPLGRADFEDMAPAVLVEQPLPGQVLKTPVAVSGTVRASLAAFGFELVSSAGDVLARRLLRPGAVAGARGGFSCLLPYSVPRSTRGTLVVFSVPAKGGSRDVVRVPVRLLGPGRADLPVPEAA